MTAPERIWLGKWWSVAPTKTSEDDAEYVRADLAALEPQPHCTCHPDDNPPKPCPQKYALTECRNAVNKPQPDPRDEVIARLVEALEMMRSTYPYNPPCYGWQEQVEAHKAAKAALAAANPSYHQNQKGK